MAKGYNLEQTGPQVQEAINKSLNLTTATQGKDGLMSAQDKQKLDSLDSELAGKVDKVPGKGLSTNDYDNTEKGKVASAYQKPVGGIPASDLAEGVIPDTSQFITKTVNDLANYYLKTETYSRSETYNKTEVDALIALIKQFTYQVVSELPEASGSTMYKLYLVPSADPQTQNVKDEYITVRSGSEGAYTYAWEQIGSTAIDLSGYVTTQALNAALANYTTTANLTTLLAAKQDVIADLSTIRSGAAAGATAYQKPGTGIPKTDLENGVKQSLDLADSAIQAEPTGVDVPVEPSLYATKEEVDELEAEVNGLFGSADADLDIADENGNVLARFEDGDFRVKNFDSAKAPQQGDTIPDFAIIDENGRAIVVFRDGNIQTKNFDSETFGKEWFVGKKVSIIGDSISTAPNHNAVEFTVLDSDISQGRTLQGYPTYYDIGTTIGGVAVTSGMVGVLTSFSPVAGDEGKTIGKPQNYNTAGTSGVSSYTETWWYKMATELGMEVLQNVSWSGASISSHEGNANDYKTSYAWHPAQINKLATRDAGGNTIKPDVVIIYRGTNDMTHSPYTSLTDFGADAMSIPDTDYSDSSYDFKVAYCMTIKKIREAYPQAKIIVCTLNLFKRLNDTQFPTNNGYNTLPEYNNAIREVANMMGCGLIEFDKDGITFENCYPTYISDNATHPTHPNPTGHTRMAEKAIIDIKNY